MPEFDREIWDCSVLEKGAQVGRWRADRYLGVGGFGAVYGVTHMDDGRRGALKIFHGDVTAAADEWKTDFCREAEILQALQDTRHLPVLYDQGEYKGRPYFVREELDPMEPDELPSETDELKKFLFGVSYSLMALHKCGWIHCDIKPWNIARKRDGMYVLIDFGSARKIDTEKFDPTMGASTYDLLRPMIMPCGTHGYDAPEISLTVARDIYALGRVIRDCFAEDVPFEWGVIINRCISNRPDMRYPDVESFVKDVEAIDKIRDGIYWRLRKERICRQREIERSLAHAEEVVVSQEEILKRDEAHSAPDMKVFAISLTRNPRCRFVLRDKITLDENTLLIVSGKGILDAEISGPSSSAVILRNYAALNNLTDEMPPENDLTYVMVGPGSSLNFPNVTSADYKRFFPGRRRILRDLDAATYLSFGGPDSFVEVEAETLKAIGDSAMPERYKKVLADFFKGEAFTVQPEKV